MASSNETSLNKLVDNYPARRSPTIGHMPQFGMLLSESLALQQKDGRMYSRQLVGGVSEGTSSTVEFPDLDINGLFKLPEGLVKVMPMVNGFLNKIKLLPGGERTMNEIIEQMQTHGQEGEEFTNQTENKTEHNSDKIKPTTEKSYVKVNDETFLNSSLCRWQLLGPIKAMEHTGFDMDASSKAASQVGLKNGVLKTMEYDTAVCRRGHLKGERLKRFLLELYGATFEHPLFQLEELIDFVLCLYPEGDGLQVDYTVGFCVPVQCIPERDLEWIKRVSGASWPGSKLIEKVTSGGAVQMPKAFKDDTNKNEKAMSWRSQFSLDKLLLDPDYEVRKVLIIMKDMKNKVIQPIHRSHVKSYFLKAAIVWAMFKNADRRKSMSELQLLQSSLEELRMAYKDGNLPDFFNTKYNHLHRSRHHTGMLKSVSEKILEISEDLDTVLPYLYRENERFQETCLATYKAKLSKLNVHVDKIFIHQEIVKTTLINFLEARLRMRPDVNMSNISSLVENVFSLARLSIGSTCKRKYHYDFVCNFEDLNIEEGKKNEFQKSPESKKENNFASDKDFNLFNLD